MGKRYVIDTETLEAVSPKEKKKRNKERLPEKPFRLYVPTSSKNLPSKASENEILEIMKSCELGFVKGVLPNDHEYSIFGIETEELEPFSDTQIRINIIEESVTLLSHAKKFHELSFVKEREEKVIGYQTSERVAWEELIKKIKA